MLFSANVPMVDWIAALSRNVSSAGCSKGFGLLYLASVLKDVIYLLLFNLSRCF